jgi:hypothetical protein
MKIRIFSDRSCLPPGLPHVAILEPFWGPSGRDPDTQLSFKTYRETGEDMFELTSLDAADQAVLPFDWTYTTWERATFVGSARDLAANFAARAAAAGKPIVIFRENDDLDPIPFDDVILFSTALARSSRSPQEFALPGWTEDLLSKYHGGRMELRAKRARPTVGFCGFAAPLRMPLSRAKIKEATRWMLNRTGMIRFTSVVPGPYVRVQALRTLEKNGLVDTDFLIRGYRSRPKGGRWKNAISNVDVERESQLEFLNNILQSDYVLCTRGHGNFSYRLYETLSCGRIPLFIDTDCVLPFDFDIDWRKFCIWVDEADLSSIAERVLDFHHSLSPDEFIELQIACRRLWEEWLSPEGFFRNFYRHVDRLGVATPERPSG